MKNCAVTNPIAPVRAAFFRRQTLLALAIVFVLPSAARAHVGNKDVFETITAGPYKFSVTVRTPLVVPGVATIEVRSTGVDVSSLTVTPLMLTGEASHHPPTPDRMTPSAVDPTFYTGSLWLMESGSWQVRFGISGAAGPMTASIPVPAAPTAILHMQRGLGILLAVLGFVLILGIVGIVIAAVGESRLSPGLQPDGPNRRRGLIAGCLALVLTIVAVYWGGRWWDVEAADYAKDIYQSSDLRATLGGANRTTLDLRIGDPIPAADGKPATWKPVKLGRMLLDHGHLMHLYAIREPDTDEVFHLHPVATSQESFGMDLPAMPPGTYRLFADIVYRNGFPETETSTLNIPANFSGGMLSAEDASASPPPLSRGELGPAYKLPDGYTMVFDRPATIAANIGYTFRFHLLDVSGRPASDMQPYLGMAGHAAFVKSDFTTFAHTHPEGSVAMPAMMLAAASTASIGSPIATASSKPDPVLDVALGAVPDTAMTMQPSTPISSTVEFPYGFPSPGRYRIFIQMKHAATVETGVFDVDVR
jgi:hypothetical protein